MSESRITSVQAKGRIGNSIGSASDSSGFKSSSETSRQRRRRNSVNATRTAIFCAQVVNRLSPRKVSRLRRIFIRDSCTKSSTFASDSARNRSARAKPVPGPTSPANRARAHRRACPAGRPAIQYLNVYAWQSRSSSTARKLYHRRGKTSSGMTASIRRGK